MQIDLLQIYYSMCLSRAMEDRIHALFLQGRIKNDIRMSRNREAITVGATVALPYSDYIVPQWQDSGMWLARGLSPRVVMGQALAWREDTPARMREGKGFYGGDMHHGIVPLINAPYEPLSIACGMALTSKMRKRSTVVLASCGDETTDKEAFHEAVNFAAQQKLPLVLVVENNRSVTPLSESFSGPQRSEWTYEVPVERVDGLDVLAVIEVVRRAAGHVRSGEGPLIVECDMSRARDAREAHSQEVLTRDPLQQFEAYLLAEGILTTTRKAEVEATIRATVGDAVDFVERNPVPDGATMVDDIFAPDGPIAIIGEPGSDDPHYINAINNRTGRSFTAMRKAQEALGRR